MSHPLFEKAPATLDGALNAIATRGYWSAYPEMPSPKLYGETAPTTARRLSRPIWASSSPSTSRARQGWHGASSRAHGIDWGELPGV